MKTTRFTLIAILLLCTLQWSVAQDNSSPRLLWIHEDDVLVDKTSEYIQVGKDLVSLMAENNFTGLSFTSFRLEDNTFMFVSWLENMAQLDNDPWAALAEKAGEDKVQAVMSGFGGKYNSHIDYTAVFHPELSYKAEQLQEEGNNYREWDFFYYNERHQEEMMSMAREWKKLYEDQNIAAGYTVYSNGLGHEGPVIVIHRWAKNRVEMAENAQKANQAMGEAAQKLWERTEALGYRMETKRGWFMPDLSYMPER